MAELTVKTTKFVLDAVQAMSAELAGGKGAALAQMSATFPVPDFFVISAEAFMSRGLRAAAKREVEVELAGLGDGPFAVRSSALEEDGAAGSHAGQFETELNVAAGDVPTAAFRVWKSGFSDGVAAYRKERGLGEGAQPPAVVVQRMVDARIAGVAFSADPVNGARGVVVVTAVAGLADALVSGEVDGDGFRVHGDGSIETMSIEGEAAVASDRELEIVAELARKAETHFGAPQDIEWAFEGDDVRLLQSRPITTLDGVAQPQEAADAITIWDNSNIVESYPGVTSPLTFSFARYVYSYVYQSFARLMGVPRAQVMSNRHVFGAMLGRIDGRIYYNLLNWYRALAMFPGFKSNRAFMETMMGVSQPLPEHIAERIAPPTDDMWLRLLDQAKLVRVGLGLASHQLRLWWTKRAFYKRLNDALETSNAAIDQMSAGELVEEYRKLEDQLLRRWDAPLVNDFLCMVAFGATQKAMQKWAGEKGADLLSRVLVGQGDIISAEPARRIREMGIEAAKHSGMADRLARGEAAAMEDVPELKIAFEDYIRKFGDRCAQELKLEACTLHEDPTPVLKAVAAAARSGGGAGEREPGLASRDITSELVSGVMDGAMKSFVASRLLRWTRARVRDRENLRFERTRLFGRVRRIFLNIGARLAEAGRLSDPRDVFNLTVEETLGAVDGTSVTGDLKSLVALREKENAASLMREDPPERFSTHGHAVDIDAVVASPLPAPDDAGERRTGLACCRGRVTASVRVVSDPRVEALEPGEILVARHTDPGWIAVFANAAGVIAERGSLLSHSAIVAREMGVPCVVGLKGATAWLQTGDTVLLDGADGSVTRISRAMD